MHRKVTVDYDGINTRIYNLCETYNSDYAINNPSVLDTSFMVLGSIEDSEDYSDMKYEFTSDEN